jgi:hypothetical protein
VAAAQSDGCNAVMQRYESLEFIIGNSWMCLSGKCCGASDNTRYRSVSVLTVRTLLEPRKVVAATTANFAAFGSQHSFLF